MKNLIIVSLMLGSFSLSYANEGTETKGHGKEMMGEAAQAINAACAPDAATAGCGDKKVGTGLMKCIHAYKKEHKDFKVSENCKKSMMTMKAEHKSKHHKVETETK